MRIQVLAPVHVHVEVRGHAGYLPLLVCTFVFETMLFTEHEAHKLSVLAGLQAPWVLPVEGLQALCFSHGSCMLVH